MCDIVLGAEIERALRAVQRDEGWNCKGAHSATIAIPGLGEKGVAGLRQPEIQRIFGGRVLRIPTVYEKSRPF